MDKLEFLNTIYKIKMQRKYLFSQEIRNSDVYTKLNLHPSECIDSEEKLLLDAVKAFDKCVNLHPEILNDFSEEEQLEQIKKAEHYLTIIKDCIGRIDWQIKN